MAQWKDIAATLRDELGRSGLPAGARVPTERDLAQRFGVARNTVRRALGTLVEDGTITRHVGSGSYLQPPKPRDDLLARIIGVSPRDLLEVRLLLEPRAAALAALHANSEELDRIADAEAHARAATEINAFEHWDAEFHRRIFAAAHNELLYLLCELLSEGRTRNAWLDLKARAFSESRLARYDAEHGAVLQALQRRNPEAAEAAMRGHLETVRANLFSQA
jgi:DNA-binding FadR family transcriptional regulator